MSARKSKVVTPREVKPGQLIISFTAAGGQGSQITYDVATKEEAASVYNAAKEGRLETLVGYYGGKQPTFWCGRPMWIRVDGLPPDWIPWLEERLVMVKGGHW